LGAFVAGFFFSILPMVLLAVPMYSLLNRRGLVNLWTCIVSGVLSGAVFGAVLRLPSPPRAGDVLVMASIGASAALGFWLVWRTGQAAEA
jgi:ABC-type branched-subunit amino acid transport system permease subunit